MKQIQIVPNIWRFRLTKDYHENNNKNNVALKLNKVNAMLTKLRHRLDIKTLISVSMHCLSPIYAMLHLFNWKTLIQLKGFIFFFIT